MVRNHRLLPVSRAEESYTREAEWVCANCKLRVWSHRKPKRRDLRKSGMALDCDEQDVLGVLGS